MTPPSSLAQAAPELPNLGAAPESWQNLGKKNGAAVSFVGASSYPSGTFYTPAKMLAPQGNAFENRRTRKGSRGSNPFSSARKHAWRASCCYGQPKSRK